MMKLRLTYILAQHFLPLLLAATAITVISPEPLSAHLRLVGSSPAAGSELARAPEAVRLRFSLPVQIPLSEIVLIGPAGPVPLPPVTLATGSTDVLTAPLPTNLAAGAYLVQWRVAGADGHPISGELRFTILAPEPQDPADTLATAKVPDQDPGTSVEGADASGGGVEGGDGANGYSPDPAGVIVRWVNFAALLALLGAVSFRLFVMPRLRRREAPLARELDPDVTRGFARLGTAAATVALLAALARLYMQADALGMGVDEGDRIRGMLLQSTWGWGWLAQIVGSGVALVGFRLGRRRPVGWAIAAGGALVAAISPALSGHAAASLNWAPAAITADALHVLGAGGWLGSLLVLFAVAVPVAKRSGRVEYGPATRALVVAFSPVALGCAALLVATGVFTAWLHVGGVTALWTTAYGRTLLLKLALLLPVLAAGAFNWRRATPVLRDNASVRSIRRSAGLELAAAVLVLLITAALVATPPPSDVPQERPAQSL
jgi:copper transport protein